MGGTSLSSPRKSSYSSIQGVTYSLVAIFFEQILSLYGRRASSIITPVRSSPALPLGGVTFDIFLKVDLLDHVLYLFFELVAIFCVVSLNLVELTPFSRLRFYNIRLWI